MRVSFDINKNCIRIFLVSVILLIISFLYFLVDNPGWVLPDILLMFFWIGRGIVYLKYFVSKEPIFGITDQGIEDRISYWTESIILWSEIDSIEYIDNWCYRGLFIYFKDIDSYMSRLSIPAKIYWKIRKFIEADPKLYIKTKSSVVRFRRMLGNLYFCVKIRVRKGMLSG